MELMKVVFHINEIDKWKTVLTNTNNFIKDIGKENVNVEIVANGAAVQIFGTSDQIKRNIEIDEISRLSTIGVKINLCKNSLIGFDINDTTLPEYAEVVPSAITKLVKLQMEGYAYIKP
ncbi:hypothetical protein bsdtw1_03626 [Clostridium fungisolvens]|uniref:Uncharacterized protein n=2 Tax=Clostridium fungisolvens TaxID=1604897 RepID=A0A6V8SJZ5_9CLOT|nr:hypothetical protein bsdtw1_03626 [Clostridium fungisolvens]